MLLNRETDLYVHGPKGIKEIILLQLRASGSFTGYNLYFNELESNKSQIIFEDEKVIVKTIPLEHRIYTNGFLFQEKNVERRLNIEKIEEYQIDKLYFNKIKNGGNITLDNGTIIENSELTFEPIPAKSYAYCSDTKYNESIIPIIENTDYLYHESTFLENELFLAQKTMHSTAIQAATIAKKAKAKNLILGHYSTRYGNLQLFKEEAETIFPNTQLADDGKEFEM